MEKKRPPLPKKPNPVARELSDPKFSKRIVKSKIIYDRKKVDRPSTEEN
jgi:hypothetical protein